MQFMYMHTFIKNIRLKAPKKTYFSNIVFKIEMNLSTLGLRPKWVQISNLQNEVSGKIRNHELLTATLNYKTLR